jgi:four helix bundle protein
MATIDRQVSAPKGRVAATSADRLGSFAVYGLARELFDAFWNDSEILARDFRGRELVRQQIRSLDSICANIEEGFGRGYGKEYPHYLKIARGEARESLGRFERCGRLLPAILVNDRIVILNRIIGGLTRSIMTLERKKAA